MMLPVCFPMGEKVKVIGRQSDAAGTLSYLGSAPLLPKTGIWRGRWRSARSLSTMDRASIAIWRDILDFPLTRSTKTIGTSAILNPSCCTR